LKREIRDLDARMDTAARHAAKLQEEVIRLESVVQESEALKVRLALELQEAEKTMLSTDHRVSSLAADLDRACQRLRLASSEIARLVEERTEVERTVAEAERSLIEVSAQKTASDEEIQLRTHRSEELRIAIENSRRDLSGLQAQVAVLQERRSTVAREL